MPGSFGKSESLERSLDALTEALDRVSSNVEAGNRQSALGGSRGRTVNSSGGGGGASAFGGFAGKAAGVAGALVAGKAGGFATKALKAGFASFALSRGTIGFEGAITNGTIAALRDLPGGSAIVDRRLGPAERAISRARGVVEPIVRGGGLRNKKDLAKVGNKLIERFEGQEQRVEASRDFFRGKLQQKTNEQAGAIKQDFEKLGAEFGKGFLDFVKANPQTIARGLFGAGGFAVPKFGGGS